MMRLGWVRFWVRFWVMLGYVRLGFGLGWLGWVGLRKLSLKDYGKLGKKKTR